MRAQVDDFAWPGATVQRSVPSGTQVVPYWDTPAFDNLTVGEGWDLVFIMLGEYDALTKASGFPVDIWPSEGCGTPGAPSLDNCTFADDYIALIRRVHSLARKDSSLTEDGKPLVCMLTPTPLMAVDAIGADQQARRAHSLSPPPARAPCPFPVTACPVHNKYYR